MAENIEINVKITEINNAIARLKKLQTRCSGISTVAPTTVGGGKTVNELEEIASTYKDMQKQLVTLISNTIDFLQNVSDSFAESDAKAAQGLSGSGGGTW